MLALLNELRNLVGWRGFLAFLAIAVVSVLAFDITTNGRAWYETYNLSQKAKWAAMQAEGEARTAEATARAKQAEADKAKYEALIAATTAANAPQQKAGEAQKAEGEGAVAIARTPYADKLAEQELRQRTAEADLKEAEAARARAEKERAQAETRRAKIGAAKDLVECRTGGYVLNAMTGQGCDEPNENGDPPDQTEKLARLGFKVGVPRDVDISRAGNYVPRGEAEEQMKIWTRYVKDRGGYAAFAVAEGGSKFGAVWDMQTEAAASSGALGFCSRKGGVECRVIATHEPSRVGDGKMFGREFRSSMNSSGLAVTQQGFDKLTCEVGINGNCPPDQPAAGYTPDNLGRLRLGPDCARWLAGFRTKSKGHGVFAAGQGGCGWSFNAPDNRAAALAQCARNNGANCQVIAEK
jgi:hypothetical protein